MTGSAYTIRRARADELPLLGAIEVAAASRFRETPYPFLLGWDPLPLDFLQVQQAHGLVWVAVDAQDRPVGFAVARPVDGAVYLHEIDVHPQHARSGLGKRLIEAIVAWARDAGYPAVTLSTFADVPWNGPYYARLGFQIIPPEQLTPGLQDVRRWETEAGLPPEKRVCMRLLCT